MKLAELIDERCVLLDAPVATKEQLFRDVIKQFQEVDLTNEPDVALEAVLKREQVMSTGIGGGVAIPHAQSAAMSRLAVALVRPEAPIEFEAIDGRPVSLVFLILGPEERGGFVRVLARISRLLYDGEIVDRLLSARSVREAVQLIARKEEESRT